MMKQKIYKSLLAIIPLFLVIICAPSCGALKGENFPGTTTASGIAKKSYYHALHRCYTITNGPDDAPTQNYQYNANGRIKTEGDNQSTYGYPDQKENAEDEGQIDRDIETPENTVRQGMPSKLTYRSLFPNFWAANKVLFPNGLTPAKAVKDDTNCSAFYNGTTWAGHVNNDFSNGGLQITVPDSTKTGFTDTLFDRVGYSNRKFESDASSSTVNAVMEGMGYKQSGTNTENTVKEQKQVYYLISINRATYDASGQQIKNEDMCLRTNQYHYKLDDNNYWTVDTAMSPLIPTTTNPSDLLAAAVYTGGKCSAATGKVTWQNPKESGLPAMYLTFQSGEYFQFFPRCEDLSDEGVTGTKCSGVEDSFAGQTINGTTGSFDTNAKALESILGSGVKISVTSKDSEGHKEEYKFQDSTATAVITGTTTGGANGYLFWRLEDNDGFTVNVSKTATREWLADKAIKYLGGTSRTAQKLTQAEKAVLYQYYLLQWGTEVSCDDEDPLASNSETQSVKWSNGPSHRATCTIGLVSSQVEQKNMAIDYKDRDGFFGKKGLPQDAINELNKIDIDDSFSKIPQTTYDTVSSSESRYDRGTDGGGDGDGSATGATKKDCYTGAGSLGWVVCPIVYDVSSFIKDKYNTWVMPALQINTTLFGSSGNNNTYIAWNIFRNIANVAFVIVFLIVIFSQLTGVGLDNYGIKKVLPKLIIGAILINCSYIICQLAIDVANILGYGIAGIFKSITNNIGVPKIISVEGVNVSSDSQDVGALANGAGLQMVVALIVGVITTAAVLSQGTAIIIPVLLAVLGVAISLFTLIAILAMRQAAAVLLVVASPLAFVAYMLPNTKKLFSMWLKAIQGVLLAFPACSALIYGGDMVGHILISTSNGSTWVLISAAIVSVAPVFFIPKLIRGSMGAIANVTSNLGRGISSGSQRFINSTQAAKNIRDNSEAARKYRSIMRRSGLTRDENGNLVDRWSRRRGPVRWASDRLHQGAEAYKSRVKRIPIIGDALARPVEQHQMNRDAVRNQAAEEAIAYGRAGSTYGDTGLSQLNSRVYDAKGKQEDAYVSGAERQIKLNAMTMLDGKTKIDPSDLGDLKKGLQEAIEAGNDRRIKAFANVLSAKGEDGRDMVRDAIQDAAPTPNSAAGKKTLASHIMENFNQAYKENSRSTYDWLNDANRNGVSAAGSIRNRVPEVGSLKESSLLNMDDKEFGRLNTGLLNNSISISSAQKAQLLDMIDKALTSEAASSAKLNRKADLDTLRTKLRS